MVDLSVSDFQRGEFNLYPNPASNSITLTSNTTINQITIVDINGRVMHTIIISEQKSQHSIEVGSLLSGIYFIELQSGANRETLKFLKQ